MPFKAAHGIFIAMALMVLSAARPAAAEPVALVGFGDSLMAGYQLPAEDAFPAQLERALRARGAEVAIANAGVSGDTTSGGLARLDWSVPDGTKGVILELGANDALRGIPPEQTEQNLDRMISGLKGRGMAVLLVGMLAPPNMGAAYGERFNGMYQRLAEKHQVPLYPFFLDGVVTHADLQLEDGMHPNSKGVAVMVDKMLPSVHQFLKSLGVNE
ncbi:arylesterase [Mycoplana sp. MJR14]|uniref:arylesterase n=1 Tax=Mycoplana sp. MJR14 TaxID=3032583 RepID=UPI0023DC916A|nr:arylesterase [Mycoplana sp. MJR14]MDF1633290.1 arylesterase [Mycoplana sp. MJR14]